MAQCRSMFLLLGSSTVEHSAVNRNVVGSNPTRGANLFIDLRVGSPAKTDAQTPTVGSFVGMLLKYPAQCYAMCDSSGWRSCKLFGMVRDQSCSLSKTDSAP